MPWRQVDAMNQRFQFVRDARRRLMTFTDLCALYGISRTVGPKQCGCVSSELAPRLNSGALDVRLSLR
jgi:hypothetical protein